MDCSPPGSSVHGISQARILEWVATSHSRGSSWPRDWTCIFCVSCIDWQILYHCTTCEESTLGLHNWQTQDPKEDAEAGIARRLHKITGFLRRGTEKQAQPADGLKSGHSAFRDAGRDPGRKMWGRVQMLGPLPPLWPGQVPSGDSRWTLTQRLQLQLRIACQQGQGNHSRPPH